MEYSRYFHDVGSPLPQSAQRRLEAVNLDHFFLPHFGNNTDFFKLVRFVGYARFVSQADQRHKDRGLPPITRPEMEAGWWRALLDKCLIFDARRINSTDSDEKKLRFKQELFREAMEQRNDPSMEQYWARKAETFPGLDISEIPFDDVTDRLPAYLSKAKEIVDEGKIPWVDPLFATLEDWELSVLKDAFRDFYPEEDEEIEKLEEVERFNADMKRLQIIDKMDVDE